MSSSAVGCLCNLWLHSLQAAHDLRGGASSILVEPQPLVYPMQPLVSSGSSLACGSVRMTDGRPSRTNPALTVKGVTQVIDTRVVGAYISELRRDADMTQAEMANRLNVTHQAVSKWENGLALPDVQTLVDLAQLFGVSVDRILSGGDQRHAPAPAPAVQLHRVVVDGAQSDDTEDPPSDRSLCTSSTRPAGSDSSRSTSGTRPAGSDSSLSASGTSPAGSDGNLAVSGTKPACSDGSVSAGGTRPVGFDLGMLAGLAPFMSRETVDRIFEKACAGEVDADQVMSLAPFVSREQLEKAVDMIADGRLSAHHLCSLAPFVGSEALRKAVRKVRDGSLDVSILMSLAPFMGPDLIDELVDEIIDSD